MQWMNSREKLPFAKKLGICWNGGFMPPAERLIELATLYALDGWEIKVCDGDSAWSERRGVTPAYVKSLHDAGLVITGYQYTYCDNQVAGPNRGSGVPVDEALTLARQADLLNLDGITSDLEIECEGHEDFVAIYFDTLHTQIGKDFPIAAYTWADLTGHSRYPMQIIADSVHVLRPMIYRVRSANGLYWRSKTTFDPRTPGADYFLDSKRLIAPAFSVTESLYRELVEDFDIATQNNVVGESYWEYASLIARSNELSNLIKPRGYAPVRQELTPEDKAEFLDACTQVYVTQTERIHKILSKYGAPGERTAYWTAQALRATISNAKEVFGLNE